MKVLVACEHSGVVREAFAALGHDAWSCDILPTLVPGQHIQADVLTALNDGWDLMIAHPPCQYLSSVGNRHLKTPGRAELREAAMAFFMQMANAPIPRICVENPVGYPNTAYRKPDQIIHPYMFGDPQMKRTCLWLKNLPPLAWAESNLFGFTVTSVGKPEPYGYLSEKSKKAGKPTYFTDGATRDPLERSRTFPGIASAMASQWSGYTTAQFLADIRQRGEQSSARHAEILAELNSPATAAFNERRSEWRYKLMLMDARDEKIAKAVKA